MPSIGAVIVSAKFFDKRLKFRDEFWMRIGDKKEKKGKLIIWIRRTFSSYPGAIGP